MNERRRGNPPETDRASWPHTLALAAGSVLVAALLCLTPQGQQLEWRSFDLASTIAIAPKRPPELSSVIVAIDEPSFAEYQRQWPWPRDYHARLVEQLRAAGARGIVLDLVFAEPSSNPSADASLARAMAPDVVLAADMIDISDGNVEGTREVLPLPALLEAAARIGFAKLPLHDGIARRIPPQDDALSKVVVRDLLKEPADPPGDALIQYFGPHRSYHTVSYYQASDWHTYLPNNPFQDKLVIVGFGADAQAEVAAGSADAFGTSYTSRGEGWTFGAEIHATIIDNLRYRLWIEPMPLPAAIVLALGLAAATGYPLRRFHPWRAALWTALGLVAIPLVSFALLQFGRAWLPPVLPATALVLMSVGRTGLGYIEERARRQRIVTMFGHYLAPAMVEILQRKPELAKLGGEVRELTILFCDVRGFTTISERMQADPERLTHLVNRILTALSNCVLAEGGTIDKYIGDCVMAFWNAPLDEPEHALRAARAALAMIESIPTLNQELANAGLPSVAIGVGLNTGRCVVGNMGSDRRFGYSAIGDAVNLASRLESASKELGVSIVIGPETAQAIGERLPMAFLKTIHVKGKEETIAVHTLVPELADRPDALRELRAVQARLNTERASQELIERASEIAPSLKHYYARVGERWGDKTAGP